MIPDGKSRGHWVDTNISGKALATLYYGKWKKSEAGIPKPLADMTFSCQKIFERKKNCSNYKKKTFFFVI